MRIAFLLAATLIVSSYLFSQVHIRERVELKPQAKQDSAVARLTTQKSAGLLVAPRTGNLLIRPESVSRLGEPTPENAYLEVTINGTTKRQIKVLPFLTVSSSFTYWYENRCTEQFVKLTHYFSFSPIESYDTIKVSKGDQLEFLYHGGLDNPTVSSYLNYYNGGVTLQTLPADYFCWFPGYLIERCLVSLRYEEAILLGESKYYYVVEEHGGLFIKDDADPMNPPAERKTDVTFTAEATSGDKLGVYYEEKKPMANGQPLPDGIIRLIGRYLDPDDVVKYKFRLAATVGEDYLSVEIQVKKPDVLGDPDLTDQARHSIVKDVTSSDADLDALVIKYAGENGIPPQIIKGQIEKETSFEPAWRYEPFKDLDWQRRKYKTYFAPDLPFNVREGILNDLPASHKNVSPAPYVKDPAKIGDFAVEHWFDRYVQRGAGGEPDVILGSNKLTEFWFWVFWSTSFWMEQSGVLIGIPELKRHTHDFVKGRILDGTFEGFHRIAQTRKVTSYGYVQMLYITAVDAAKFAWKETGGRYGTIGRAYVDKRDVTQYPEKLNEQDFLFPRYSDFTLFNLRVAITEAINGKKIEAKKKYSTPLAETIPEGNWPTGFDKVWTRAMQWHNLGEAGYGQAVMRDANNYLPAYKK